MPTISEKDVATLRLLANATGSQGPGKRRDADVMQQTLRGVLSRIEPEETPCT